MMTIGTSKTCQRRDGRRVSRSTLMDRYTVNHGCAEKAERATEMGIGRPIITIPMLEFCEAEAGEQGRTLASLSILPPVATTWSKPWMRGPDPDRGW